MRKNIENLRNFWSVCMLICTVLIIVFTIMKIDFAVQISALACIISATGWFNMAMLE